MSILWRTLVTLVLLHESLSRKYSPGPSVDPGVFVITHISTCRNGAGYCILGFSCEVDRDFTKDDLGGHCNGLGEAFNPKAQFVCCRENPELHPPKPVQIETEKPFQHEVILETSTSVVTETVTEIVTELEPVTEMVTKIEEVTTEEILKPGIVLDDPEKSDCVTAALLGLDCDQELQPKKAERLDDPVMEEQFVLLSSSKDKAEVLENEEDLVPEFEVFGSGVDDSLKIKTSPSNLQPDRDETFESILSNQQVSIPSATNNAGLAELRSVEPTCGKLGGAAVLQAYGRAAHNLLPDLVFSWLTGGQGQKQKQARLDDEELEPRIIAGEVTSTVLFCWMAAIMEKSKDGPDQFICTGTLVEPDLIVTSASCTLRMFETGVDDFNVVLGDANLQIDLPFGVQAHEISEVIVHENYRPDDSFHYEDIGLIKLKTNAKMETTVCLLCLPETFKSYAEDNCTVVGYGRPSKAALNQFSRENPGNVDADLTDGILRTADLPIVDTISCQEYLDVNARSDEMHSGFICAGGKGHEESCYIAMDGGSPLACKRDESHYELAGLVTFGTSCSHDQSPSLFTNVSKHVKWIKSNYEAMKKRRSQ